MNEEAILVRLEALLPSKFSPLGVNREDMVVKGALWAELWPYQIPEAALGGPGLGKEEEEPRREFALGENFSPAPENS